MAREKVSPLDFLFVCAGGDPMAFRDRATLAWLRYLSSQGVRIGGVSGGPVILARAGIMDGYHMTVHWGHAPAVAEAFPNVLLTRSIYIVDRNRLTCAGGTTRSSSGVLSFTEGRQWLDVRGTAISGGTAAVILSLPPSMVA